LAVGNPFNLESTVTAGIVSAKARNINILDDASSIESFIQTDAVVNSGNSGGALVNTIGELVGINSAIMTHSGNFEGYSFAVPANLVHKVIKDLKEFGVVQRGYLGIGIDNLTVELTKYLGINTLDGVYVRTVTRGGAASEAGLQAEDVITKINGIAIKSMPELQEQVGQFRPGNSISIEYIRDGKYQQTKVTLLNRSNSISMVTTQSDKILRNLGFELRELHRDEVQKLGHRAVRVVSITNGSKIAAINMDPGFIIEKINGKTVNNVDEVINMLEDIKGKINFSGVYDGYESTYEYSLMK
jgi:S1-C subfamily serine protease